jgi:PAS domain S-box-containing protein/putative nucleotidyltransferase with HDIG domain
MKKPARKAETLAKLPLEASELRYRRLFEAAQDGILILDAETGAITDVNPFLIDMLGYSNEELVKKKLWEVGAFKDIKASKDAFEVLQKNTYIRYKDLPLRAKDGRLIQVEFVSNVYLAGSEKVIQCNIRDITARIQAETQMRSQADLLESTNDAIIASDAQYRLTVWNAAAESLYGWSSKEALGLNEIELIRTEWPNVDAKKMRRTIAQTGHWRGEATQARKDGTRFPVEVSSITLRNSSGDITGYVSANHDITERKQAEERMQRQISHLTALNAIDRAIVSNFNLELSLSEILIHVTAELGVDAASILILNSNSQILEYGAARGFRTKAAMKAQVRMGESYAGRVALERQLVQIPNLREDPNNVLLTSFLAGEDFVCYYGMPLIAKGKVKGVLEAFHRTELEPDAELLNFLKTLARQAAIAIENAMLFEDLQRSNSELFSAYDATIEGWSSALDLRDKETEGHTQRVTEMTMHLARSFGLGDDELVQVRWGALLHDIGKMGVPDGILLKSGPLTNDERVIMRQHPIFAYKLLSPIGFLQRALDIPYCHHEKWDGSGYPRGLKGAQIPLVARIFAVVDVWDALTSNRSYRRAWTNEKAREYIRASSGTYFDPQVVDVFMKTVH